MNLFFLQLFLVLATLNLPLAAQSIEEKKQALDLNQEVESSDLLSIRKLEAINQELEQLYLKAANYSKNLAPTTSYEELAHRAESLHKKREEIAGQMKVSSVDVKESEVIWHLPDANVKQLVMEFAGGETVFIIPDDIGLKKVAIVSGLALPKQLGSSMLELILSQMGVGVRQLNPFCKELFLTSQSEGFEKITDRQEDLWLIPDQSRVCFVLSSDQLDMKQFSRALTRFIDTANTQIKPLGSHLAVIAPAIRIRQILQIYDFMARSQHAKAYRIIHLSRLAAADLQKMLAVIFSQGGDNKSEFDAVGLQIFPIHYEAKSALFIAGSEGEVKRAVALIEDLENQIELTSGKKLFWYSAKHANAKDLAAVVTKIYAMLTQTTFETGGPILSQEVTKEANPANGNVAPLVVTPTAIGSTENIKNDDEDRSVNPNIVVDAKSGAIIMVVEPAILPKLKELIAKLDTPKKMVRIDFLLFEKKVTDEMEFGIDLLKTGAAASNVKSKQFDYSLRTLANPFGASKGILNFFLSRTKVTGAPAFDISYNFLLAQDSIQINANPSILTLNGTASSVNLVDEISVNTGAVSWNEKGEGSKDSFTRAQYGITINVTPTVHASPDDENDRSITLDTNITFDTTRALNNDRPTVTRRNIKNLVRIADGDTVILGGLRQKELNDKQDSLPFLGEIPGFGKLFSYTSLSDRTTEMFIFITPHIIEDPKEGSSQLEELELRKRPGDTNEFLQAYEESQQRRKSVVFSRTLKNIFGRYEDVKIRSKSSQNGAYDGRN
jgi:general secretion pathway protein D